MRGPELSFELQGILKRVFSDLVVKHDFQPVDSKETTRLYDRDDELVISFKDDGSNLDFAINPTKIQTLSMLLPQHDRLPGNLPSWKNPDNMFQLYNSAFTRRVRAYARDDAGQESLPAFYGNGQEYFTHFLNKNKGKQLLWFEAECAKLPVPKQPPEQSTGLLAVMARLLSRATPEHTMQLSNLEIYLSDLLDHIQVTDALEPTLHALYRITFEGEYEAGGEREAQRLELLLPVVSGVFTVRKRVPKKPKREVKIFIRKVDSTQTENDLMLTLSIALARELEAWALANPYRG